MVAFSEAPTVSLCGGVLESQGKGAWGVAVLAPFGKSFADYNAHAFPWLPGTSTPGYDNPASLVTMDVPAGRNVSDTYGDGELYGLPAVREIINRDFIPPWDTSGITSSWIILVLRVTGRCERVARAKPANSYAPGQDAYSQSLIPGSDNEYLLIYTNHFNENARFGLNVTPAVHLRGWINLVDDFDTRTSDPRGVLQVSELIMLWYDNRSGPARAETTLGPGRRLYDLPGFGGNLMGTFLTTEGGPPIEGQRYVNFGDPQFDPASYQIAPTQQGNPAHQWLILELLEVIDGAGHGPPPIPWDPGTHPVSIYDMRLPLTVGHD